MQKNLFFNWLKCQSKKKLRKDLFFTIWYNKKCFSYRLRIESMLLKAEFDADMSFLEPSIEAMIAAGEGKSKQKILLSTSKHQL